MSPYVAFALPLFRTSRFTSTLLSVVLSFKLLGATVVQRGHFIDMALAWKVVRDHQPDAVVEDDGHKYPWCTLLLQAAWKVNV